MTDPLFALPSDTIAVTSDDCYTPRWVFDAMGLQFDLDVASPPGGPWHVPAARFYTAEDDGLGQPWSGVIWCNPPYSKFQPWAQKWSEHPAGALMGFVQSEVRWGPVVFGNADAVALISCDFARPDGQKYRWRHQVFVAFRGVGTEPAERLAAAILAHLRAVAADEGVREWLAVESTRGHSNHDRANRAVTAFLDHLDHGRAGDAGEGER